MNPVAIERVGTAADDIVQGLAALLVDAVDDNAGISFMAGLQSDEAAEWWRKTLSASSPRTVVLIARDDRGTRGRGIARALMQELERHAREQRFTLLLLDTCKGGAAEQLYTSLGWTRVGEVPHFALNPDGTPCDTVFFYKQLSP